MNKKGLQRFRFDARSGARGAAPLFCATLLALGGATGSGGQQAAAPAAAPDASARAQQPSPVQISRPEQKKTAHDLSDIFKATNAKPSSTAASGQPKQGKITGFDFYR